MAIDQNYIAVSDLELYLVDKEAGLPLAAGTVEFFSDVDRSLHKAVYTISGSPPNYSFVELPNPCVLSGDGTFNDGAGNNVIPYYYPYDIDGNVELYYVEVKNSDEVPQFTREAWPHNVPINSIINSPNFINYIPNGQLLAHTDVPEDLEAGTPFGQIISDVTELAQGGFGFVRPNTSTSVDNVQFIRYNEFTSDPTASPRYSVQVVCSSADPSDSFKYIRWRFSDVNKFSSDTDVYNFSFSAITYPSGVNTVPITVIKNYGTGGSPSPPEEIVVNSVSILNTQKTFYSSFSFGSNDGKNLGTNNDDYVEVTVQLPTDVPFGFQFTDFMLYFGDQLVSSFPATTDRDFMARSLTSPPPASDGSNLYLPQVLTKEGLIYDDGDIGGIFAIPYNFSGSLSASNNLMKLDGSQYLTAGYSPLGIPFSRLQSKYWNSTLNQPIYGTGQKFVSSYIQDTPNHIMIATNNFGTATQCTDGAVPTGFIFFNAKVISASGYGMTGYQSTSTSLTVIATSSNTVTAPTAGTSGFTITSYKDPTTPSLFKFIFNITTISATTLAGKYFTFHSNPANTSYYMWFTVNGTGSDPAPGGTGIKVDLESGYSASDVCTIVGNAISGCQIDVITAVLAAGIPPGAYFTFTPAGTSQQYAVWYSIDGGGSAPSSSAFNIEVPLSFGDDGATVATKTIQAINMTYFATPNLQGAFLRGYDPNKIWDVEADSRSSFVPTVFGNVLGTFQPDSFVAHSHVYQKAGTPLPQTGIDTFCFTVNANANTNETGFNETRPIDYNVQWVTRY